MGARELHGVCHHHEIRHLQSGGGLCRGPQARKAFVSRYAEQPRKWKRPTTYTTTSRPGASLCIAEAQAAHALKKEVAANRVGQCHFRRWVCSSSH